MYDIIKCKIPLKQGPQEVLYQTRDLKRLMYYYTIRADGRLVFHEVIHHVIPEDKRPYYGTKEWHQSEKARATGSLKYQHYKNIFIDYEGVLIFYVFLNNQYYEYEAVFKDNICQEINKVERIIIPPWGLKGGEHLDTDIYAS
jgi:hypothetical protein